MEQPELVSTGTKGLDFILQGGLPKNRACLLYGGPGSGKTTLALQFLRAGVASGQRCLYLTILQSRRELEDMAAAYGWSLDGIDVFELPEEVRSVYTQEQSLFRTEDIELPEINSAISEALERFRPQRLVFESLGEISLMTTREHQFFRQVVQIKQHLDKLSCTTLFTANEAGQSTDSMLQMIFHGVIQLEQESPTYGKPQRRLNVTKMRGRDYYGGYHDCMIDPRGLSVFPRLVPPGQPLGEVSTISSGNEGLDRLLGGGLTPGTTCMIAGTTGVGKSSLLATYVDAAARRGQRSVIFNFDELSETFLKRSQSFGLDMKGHIDKGLVDLQQLNVGQIAPGQFSQFIRRTTEKEHTRIIGIDSLTGYMNAMPSRQDLLVQLYELIRYLNTRGLLTFLVVDLHGFLGSGSQSSIEASYLMDAALLLRHFEHRGKLRKCIAAIKKRDGDHERTIRELDFGGQGIQVGPPLTQFAGILSGRPEFLGEEKQLMGKKGQ